MRWSWTVSFWNVHLKGAESKSLHDWAEPRGLHVENQTLFQALPSSSSGAADVQGSSKAPPANLLVRTANLLTFCHSLTHAAHKTHTQKHVQNHTRCRLSYMHKTDFKQEAYLYPSILSYIPECSFLSWETFSSAHSHFLLFSSLEKYSMFSQTVKIHLYNKPTEGFQKTTSQMGACRVWLSIHLDIGIWKAYKGKGEVVHTWNTASSPKFNGATFQPSKSESGKHGAWIENWELIKHDYYLVKSFFLNASEDMM